MDAIARNKDNKDRKQIVNITVNKATVNDKSIIARLLQLYMHDFSEFTLDDINDNGEYNYNRLDCYWIEKDRYPFLIKTDGILSGFALIRSEIIDTEEVHSIAEYFILRKYRNQGIGRQVALMLFEMFKGKWKIPVLRCNSVGLQFWEKVIKDYTKDNYRELDKPEWPGPIYEFSE